MITQAQVQSAADLVRQSNLTEECKLQVLMTIAGLQADVDTRFQELVEANRWARIYRQKWEQNTKSKTTELVTPEQRRDAMQKAKLEAMTSGKTVQA